MFSVLLACQNNDKLIPGECPIGRVNHLGDIMKRSIAAAMAVCILLLASGCTSRMGDLTVASTQLAKLDGVNLNQAPTAHHVTGEAKSFIFLFIPFGIPHLEDAIDDALVKGNGDVMTDITIHRTGWWFLVGQTGWKVTGDVVQTRRQNKADGGEG